jgi:hypothetical protein
MVTQIEYTRTGYDKIIENYGLLNAWKDENSFPIKNASDLDLQSLNKLNAIEFVFPGTKGDSSIFDELFIKFNHFLKLLLASNSIPAYIFKSEFKSQLPNRIRTYKGIFPKINQAEYCQYECSLQNGNSIIAGLIRLNENNISIYKELFYDSDTSFIIISRKLILSKGFINNIVQNSMVHKNTSYLNYLRVLNDYCTTGDIIIRMGGDGGDRYISLQLFFDPSLTETFPVKLP